MVTHSLRPCESDRNWESDKTESPCCQLTFLGIHINSIPMEPAYCLKLTRFSHGASVEGQKGCLKGDLQFNHAAMVVPPGHTFLRRMIETMKIPKCQHHYICLSFGQTSNDGPFLPEWNGRSILPHSRATHFLFFRIMGL